ncbi:MAG TPA: FecR domain-containing protein [Puia sp.]|nr:FecR domain-containing protein [Puia sp.]
MDTFDESVFFFLNNDEFIRWALSGGDPADPYWKAWMDEHPGRISELMSAKQIAQDLARAQQLSEFKPMTAKIWEKIQLHTAAPAMAVAHKSRGPVWRYAVAASVAALVVAGISYSRFRKPVQQAAVQSARIANNLDGESLNHVNNTRESRVVYLVDGSHITLQPGASVKHTVFLEKDRREVWLDGDAFFEVAKDPNRPFYVYAHDIILKVLGTSFNVTTNKTNGNITVLVRTGRVSVFKYSTKDKPEFILTPNESARYTAQTQTLIKSIPGPELANADMPVKHPISFDFEETPITRIFNVLQDAYGIKINFDEKTYAKCIITAPLHDETFEEKLNIICEAAGANYRIEKDQVWVEGSSCK